MKRVISGLTSEGTEKEKQTGKQRTPWHCYHQPLIGTRRDEEGLHAAGPRNYQACHTVPCTV